MKMTKVFSLPALDARSQILSIKDRRNGIEKPVFKLAPLNSGQTFTLVTLDLSVPGISPDVFATGSLSSQQASCVMAASLASPLYRRLTGRGVFVFCFLPRWVLRLAAFVIRGFTLHGSSSCFRKDSLDGCGRPCEPLSCLLFSALWLRCSPTILVQETPSVKDVDPTCSTTSLFGDATCLLVGPMSLDWLVNPVAVPTLPDPRFLLVLPAVHNNEVPFPLLDILAGDKVLF